MRFEVKAGGIAAIVFAMTLLSGAVFVLGLLAGYDVGRQAQIDTAQLATSYPLPSAPSSGVPSNESVAATGNPAMRPALSTSASPPAGTSTPMTTASTIGDRGLSRNSVNPMHGSSQKSATSASRRLALNSNSSTAKRASAAVEPSAADEDASTAAESDNAEVDEGSSEAASAEPNSQAGRMVGSAGPLARRKPYNIQIEAAMDITGADEMMARLQKLGYSSHLVPTEIAGQRWYKVEVGPYATAEEATDAEAELRQKYDSTYGGVTRAGSHSPAQASAADNPEE
jgi:cell division protein FtsN